MDRSNKTELFSFSPDSSKSVLFVKLSEDALLRLEEYERKALNGFKPTIQFQGDKGVITIPGEKGKVAYDFSLSLMDANKSQGSFQCMEKSEERELTSLGKIETKMQLHAKDTSIEHTKSKIEAVDKKQKTYGAKVIKTATSSQATSSQGYYTQEKPPVPRGRKPVPFLKKFLNRNLQRQINGSISSVKSGDSVTATNQADNRTPVLLSQPPLPRFSKEMHKKHVLEGSSDNYSDPRVKKQRISHCSQKEPADGVLSPAIHITNDVKPEKATSKFVNNLQAISGNKSKQDNQKSNCIEQLLNNSSQKQKTKEMEKKHILDNNIYSDPCKPKQKVSRGFLNEPASTTNSVDLSTSIVRIPATRKPKTIVSKSVKKIRAKERKLENKKKRKRQKRKAAKRLAALIASQSLSPPVLKSQQSENTLTGTMTTKDNDKNLIQLSKESVVPLIEIEKQAIETKNLFQPQSSVRTRKSSVASALIDDFLSQDSDSLQLKNEGIRTKGSPTKTSDTTGASKYDILITLGIIPHKSIKTETKLIDPPGIQPKTDTELIDPPGIQPKTDTELIAPPGIQPYVNDGCEVTSTTEKKINGTPDSFADSVDIMSGAADISILDDFLNFKEIETIEDREECREVYTAKLEEYNKLQADLEISRQYLESLENTMTIHLTNSSVFYELEAKYFETLVHHHNRLAWRKALSVQLSDLYNLIFRFDSMLRASLIA